MQSLGNQFILTFLTDDPTQVLWAANAGVQRIGLDLERIGKEQRQRGLGTRISAHDARRLPEIKEVVAGRAKLFVRLNPIHPNSVREIQRVLSLGADVLMLPYFKTVSEVRCFVDLVDGRARSVLLLETASAAILVDEITSLPGVDEIHIGLTDMMVSTAVDSRFKLLTSWFVEGLAKRIKASRKTLCIAGVARVDDASLPVPGELILAQFARLGAEGAFLTRSFARGIATEKQFAAAIQRLRKALNDWYNAGDADIKRAHQGLLRKIRAIEAAGATMP